MRMLFHKDDLLSLSRISGYNGAAVISTPVYRPKLLVTAFSSSSQPSHTNPPPNFPLVNSSLTYSFDKTSNNVIYIWVSDSSLHSPIVPLSPLNTVTLSQVLDNADSNHIHTHRSDNMNVNSARGMNSMVTMNPHHNSMGNMANNVANNNAMTGGNYGPNNNVEVQNAMAHNNRRVYSNTNVTGNNMINGNNFDESMQYVNEPNQIGYNKPGGNIGNYPGGYKGNMNNVNQGPDSARYPPQHYGSNGPFPNQYNSNSGPVSARGRSQYDSGQLSARSNLNNNVTGHHVGPNVMGSQNMSGNNLVGSSMNSSMHGDILGNMRGDISGYGGIDNLQSFDSINEGRQSNHSGYDNYINPQGFQRGHMQGNVLSF